MNIREAGILGFQDDSTYDVHRVSGDSFLEDVYHKNLQKNSTNYNTTPASTSGLSSVRAKQYDTAVVAVNPNSNKMRGLEVKEKLRSVLAAAALLVDKLFLLVHDQGSDGDNDQSSSSTTHMHQYLRNEVLRLNPANATACTILPTHSQGKNDKDQGQQHQSAQLLFAVSQISALTQFRRIARCDADEVIHTARLGTNYAVLPKTWHTRGIAKHPGFDDFLRRLNPGHSVLSAQGLNQLHGSLAGGAPKVVDHLQDSPDAPAEQDDANQLAFLPDAYSYATLDEFGLLQRLRQAEYRYGICADIAVTDTVGQWSQDGQGMVGGDRMAGKGAVCSTHNFAPHYIRHLRHLFLDLEDLGRGGRSEGDGAVERVNEQQDKQDITFFPQEIEKQKITVIEIGMLQGNGIALWHDFFQGRARVIGFDINLHPFLRNLDKLWSDSGAFGMLQDGEDPKTRDGREHSIPRIRRKRTPQQQQIDKTEHASAALYKNIDKVMRPVPSSTRRRLEASIADITGENLVDDQGTIEHGMEIPTLLDRIHPLPVQHVQLDELYGKNEMKKEQIEGDEGQEKRPQRAIVEAFFYHQLVASPTTVDLVLNGVESSRMVSREEQELETTTTSTASNILAGGAEQQAPLQQAVSPSVRLSFNARYPMPLSPAPAIMRGLRLIGMGMAGDKTGSTSPGVVDEGEQVQDEITSHQVGVEHAGSTSAQRPGDEATTSSISSSLENEENLVEGDEGDAGTLLPISTPLFIENQFDRAGREKTDPKTGTSRIARSPIVRNPRIPDNIKVIIDDASHEEYLTWKTFVLFEYYLNTGDDWVYVIEDCACTGLMNSLRQAYPRLWLYQYTDGSRSRILFIRPTPVAPEHDPAVMLEGMGGGHDHESTTFTRFSAKISSSKSRRSEDELSVGG
ncbi:unnamed protein product, partial [Amoebophrya sp. A25]|eukprot:GSA25T00021947001.1